MAPSWYKLNGFFWLGMVVVAIGLLAFAPAPARNFAPGFTTSDFTSEECLYDGGTGQPQSPRVNPTAEFDVVLFGATGFTGQITARYLAARQGNFTFAIAGRNQAKLDALVDSIEDDIATVRVPATIVADALELEGVRAMARRGKVVLTAAGPYAKYGAKVVEACAIEGVHYADLSGEFFFQRDMVLAHHQKVRTAT
jgi:hypothetical protein